MAFAHDGEVKAMYNHSDSYPSGLGTDMADWMIEHKDGDFSEDIEKFSRLQAVDEDETPTVDQKLALIGYLNTRVSTGSSDDWYVLLRDTQGKPAEALKAGFYVDAFDFGYDSLFCEWAYVVDLDRKVLEVYEGFQTSKPKEGRWSEAKSVGDDKYSAIKKVREFTLAELQENPNILKESFNDD
jgi:hypothetical protein